MKVGDFLEALREALDADHPIGLDDSPANTPEWDSVAHLNILAFIDSEFDIEASDNALTDPKKVGDMVDYLKSKGILED